MEPWRGLTAKKIEPCTASHDEGFETCGFSYNNDSGSPCTAKQRQPRASKVSTKKGGHSKFIGVTWHRQDQKFQAAIKINGKSLHLGHFVDEFEAARKYDEHARRLGRKLNFSEIQATPSPSGSDSGTLKQKRAQEAPQLTPRNLKKSDDLSLLNPFDPSEYFEFERSERRRRSDSFPNTCDDDESFAMYRCRVSNSSFCADEEESHSANDDEAYQVEELANREDGVEELKAQLSAQSLRPSLLRRSSDNTIEIVRWVEAGGSGSMRAEEVDAPPLVLTNADDFGLDQDVESFNAHQASGGGIIHF